MSACEGSVLVFAEVRSAHSFEDKQRMVEDRCVLFSGGEVEDVKQGVRSLNRIYMSTFGKCA